MAKNPFAEMTDTAPKRGVRAQLDTPRVVTGLVVIVAATFGLGYHLPLSSAHATLAEAHQKLNSSHSDTNLQLEKTTQQLLAAQKERDEAVERLKSIEDERAAVGKSREGLFEKIKGKLGSVSKEVVVEGRESGVVISIDNGPLFKDTEVTVQPSGRKLLCAVGKALKEAEAEVSVGGYTADGKVAHPKLKKDYPTAWDLSAARAVGVVRVLESCGVSGRKLSAVGHAQYGAVKLAKKSGGQIQLWLNPGS